MADSKRWAAARDTVGRQVAVVALVLGGFAASALVLLLLVGFGLSGSSDLTRLALVEVPLAGIAAGCWIGAARIGAEERRAAEARRPPPPC